MNSQSVSMRPRRYTSLTEGTKMYDILRSAFIGGMFGVIVTSSILTLMKLSQILDILEAMQ